MKNYWLMKSEPYVWSIDQQKKAGLKGATWDGVRNYQAANNLRKMKIGDECFFYHSNEGKEIVAPEEMAGKIKAAVDARQDEDFVIIARTDAIAVEGFDAAIDRMNLYLESGADVGFVEAPQNREQLESIPSKINGS